MSARDTIARCIPGSSAEMCFGLADGIMIAIIAAGYVILYPDEVRGIRDEALEEAAKEAKSWEKTARKLSRKEIDEDRSLHHSLAVDMARDVATAIRSLKGGRE